MKTKTKEWISERRNSYGIFVMHEQLKAKGLLEKQYNEGLDIVWEYCISKYNDFQNSDFDSPESSEYDCISRYVQDLVTSNMREKQVELARIIVEKTGINIVTCGQCGDVVLHKINQEEIQCPSCLLKSEPCDFPDLFY